MNDKKLIISAFNVNNLLIFSIIEKPDGIERYYSLFESRGLSEAYMYICASSDGSRKKSYMHSIDCYNPVAARDKVISLNAVVLDINQALKDFEKDVPLDPVATSALMNF